MAPLTCLVVVVAIVALQLVEAMPVRSGVGRAGAGVHGATCGEEGYLEGNICCLNCPAGKYLKSPCTSAWQRGECVECDFGTYTAHDNHLPQCLKCTKCHSDQEAVGECTGTLDRECQCKPGMFCTPDQACEVCKKCSSCKDGEVKVRNCTAVANTKCSKGVSSSSNASAGVMVYLIISFIVLIVLIAIGVVFWKWKNGTLPGCQKDSNPGEKVEMVAMANGSPEGGQTVEVRRCLLPEAVRPKSSASEEDEDRGLGCSLANSSCNSQSSLSGHPTQTLPTSSPQPSPVVPWRPSVGAHEVFPTLVPLQGEEECLRKCFQYFEDELNIDYYKRFFRHLGLKDNMIRNLDQHEDRLYELLGIWLEKEGKEASINTLLKALLAFKQRLTAENIVKRAVTDGLYERKEVE